MAGRQQRGRAPLHLASSHLRQCCSLTRWRALQCKAPRPPSNQGPHDRTTPHAHPHPHTHLFIRVNSTGGRFWMTLLRGLLSTIASTPPGRSSRRHSRIWRGVRVAYTRAGSWQRSREQGAGDGQAATFSRPQLHLSSLLSSETTSPSPSPRQGPLTKFSMTAAGHSCVTNCTATCLGGGVGRAAGPRVREHGVVALCAAAAVVSTMAVRQWSTACRTLPPGGGRTPGAVARRERVTHAPHLHPHPFLALLHNAALHPAHPQQPCSCWVTHQIKGAGGQPSGLHVGVHVADALALPAVPGAQSAARRRRGKDGRLPRSGDRGGAPHGTTRSR